MLLSSKELTMKLNHLNSLPYFFPYFGKGSCTNHVDSKGGGGVGQMSTFVYVGGRGGWDNVYMVFFPYNFT